MLSVGLRTTKFSLILKVGRVYCITGIIYTFVEENCNKTFNFYHERVLCLPFV